MSAIATASERLPEAWAAAASDSERIELFAKWLKGARPLDAAGRRSAFRLRESLSTLDAEKRAAESRESADRRADDARAAAPRSARTPSSSPPPSARTPASPPRRRGKSPAKLASPESESDLLRSAYFRRADISLMNRGDVATC